MAKILFITSRFPYPLTKGDRLRVYFQLKHLAQDHEVHLLAVNDAEVSGSDLDALSFCKSVHTFVLPRYKRIPELAMSLFKQLPLQVAFFFNAGIKKQMEKIADEIRPDHIHCHLIRTVEYAKDMKGVCKSLDFMDAFGKGMEKRENNEPDFFKRLLFRYEKKQLYRYEKKVFDYMDRFFIISEQDKKWIDSERANEIKVIPNGVDFNAFYPKPGEHKYDLVFMGNLDYPPNVTAIFFLCNEIMPLVKKQIPGIKLLIAGAGASTQIKKLRSQNIDVIERFNHISDSLAVSKIMVAPMKINIGMPNKVLQAMAMKLPCVVTTLANNSIGAINHQSIIEANTAAEFAKNIITLLNNQQRASDIGEAGYQFVKEHYSWQKQNALFNNLISH